MADKFELSIEARDVKGTGASRRLRRLANLVPGVIYGAGKPAASITVNHHHINNALKNEAFYSHILTLNMNGEQEKVVLKDLQRHPSKPQIMHIDFLRVSATENLYMNVPLHFIGEDIAPGVKVGGGVVSHLMNEVEIRCLPAALPEFIEVDLSSLELDEAVHLSELKLPEGVEIVALIHDKENDQAVASIHRPQVVVEADLTAAPVAAEVPVLVKEKASDDSKS